jgi:hypothetical protein
LEVEVFDEDTLGDDSLGICKVDLTPAFTKPCLWAVNDLYKLNDPKYNLNYNLYKDLNLKIQL